MRPEIGQPDKLKRIEALFEAAIAEPAERWQEFLLEAAPDDSEVRAEVESLLKAADSFLDHSPFCAAGELNPAMRAGDRVGVFEIVSLLGRGGMGEVYRARDARLKREVAIKMLPRVVPLDRGRVARFEREARAAAALNHPNICTIYDIG